MTPSSQSPLSRRRFLGLFGLAPLALALPLARARAEVAPVQATPAPSPSWGVLPLLLAGCQITSSIDLHCSKGASYFTNCYFTLTDGAALHCPEDSEVHLNGCTLDFHGPARQDPVTLSS